jgi:Tol biopolymer transport system component
MKPTLCFAIVTAVIMMCPTASSQQNNKAENLYQEGLMQMEGRGNYQKALDIFGQILKEFARDRRVAAKAQFQTGVCYEKLGKAEAQKAYEQTISKYPEQTDLVAQARSRMLALGTAMQAGRGPLAHRLLEESSTGVPLTDIHPSPDGKRVAYVNNYNGSLHVRDLTSGADEIVAPKLDNGFRYSPRWSPDGKRLAVMENDHKTEICVVKLIDVAAHESATIGKTEWHEWIEPSDWSSNGRFLLCGSDHSVLISIDDGSVTVLPNSIPWAEAMSPDGRFAAFRVGKKGKEGQLFVQPVGGGPREKIAECTAGNDIRVVWSPDGKAIAYAHTGGIWIVPMSEGKAGGSPQLALATPRVRLSAWTDAGLYYSQFNDQQTVRIPCQLEIDPTTGEAHSSGIQKLSTPAPADDGSFYWSPDMRRIAFAPLDQASRKITIYSADTKALTTFDIGMNGFITPALWWSPDGKEIRFGYRDEQYVPDAKFTLLGLDLGSGKTQALLPYRNDWMSFSLSADGRSMAYYKWKSVDSYITVEGIVISPFGKAEGQLAAANAPGITKLGFVTPKLSAQGDKVVFTRQEYAGGNSGYPYNGGTLWVANTDGSNTKKLATLTDIRSMVWDPSGRFIAYTGKPDTGKAGGMVLRVVQIATGVERDVPLKEYAQNDLILTQWSPDGRYIGMSVGPHWGSTVWLELHAEFWVVQGLQEGTR